MKNRRKSMYGTRSKRIVYLSTKGHMYSINFCMAWASKSFILSLSERAPKKLEHYAEVMRCTSGTSRYDSLTSYSMGAPWKS